MNVFLKPLLTSKTLNSLIFLVVFFFSCIVLAAEGENPTVDVTFKKSKNNVVYTITYGKNTKFNDNEAAPYKFVFMDKEKKELGKIDKSFFVKNKEGKASYTSEFGESFTKITLPVCLYNEKTGLAEKCTVKNIKLDIK